MNFLIVMTLVSVAFAVEYLPEPDDPYNADTLPGNPDEVKARVNCFLGKGPCDEVTAVYKKIVPDLVRQECSLCSPYIKHYHHVFINELKKNFPKEYQEYKDTFDPEGIHFSALEAAIANF